MDGRRRSVFSSVAAWLSVWDEEGAADPSLFGHRLVNNCFMLDGRSAPQVSDADDDSRKCPFMVEG